MVERMDARELGRQAFTVTGSKDFATELYNETVTDDATWDDVEGLVVGAVQHLGITAAANPLLLLALGMSVVAAKHVTARITIRRLKEESPKGEPKPAEPAPATPAPGA